MKLGEFVCRLALNAIYLVVVGLRVKEYWILIANTYKYSSLSIYHQKYVAVIN